jgi:hypothetical protein
MEIDIVKENTSVKCKDLPAGTIVRVEKGNHWIVIIPNDKNSHYAVINDGCLGNITGSKIAFYNSFFYDKVPYEIIGQISMKF